MKTTKGFKLITPKQSPAKYAEAFARGMSKLSKAQQEKVLSAGRLTLKKQSTKKVIAKS
jgi:hypothetical protein